jgi:plastocyanin
MLGLAALSAGAAIALAVSAVATVGAAAPDSASFTAADFTWHVTGGAATTATIAPGGTVTFGYPSGGSAHNAAFSDLQPSACTQTAGPDFGSVPPLPAVPAGPGWSGSCRFDTPGSYSFHCDLHPYMQGTVVVEDPNAPPPTAPTSPPGTTTAPPSGDTAPGGPSTGPGGGSARPGRLGVRVARRQRGAVLRGTVTRPAGSRIVVKAFVSRRALGARPTGRRRPVRVGSTATRRASFAVRLDAGARGALARLGRLTVTLRIAIAPPGRRTVTRTVVVVLRPA